MPIQDDVHHVEINSIKIPAERQRKEFDSDDLAGLAKDIDYQGLINPIIVNFETMELVAGERRLLAHRLLERDRIPVRFSINATPLELMHLELTENLQRKDFTWQEMVTSIYTYYQRRKAETNESIQQVGELLNIPRTTMNRYLALGAAILSGNEEVREAAQLSVATNILARQRARASNEETQNASSLLDDIFPEAPKTIPTVPVDLPAPESPVVSVSAATTTGTQKGDGPSKTVPLLRADFTEWVKQYNGEKFNFIHCDFPYGIDHHDFKQDSKAKTAGKYDDSLDVYINLVEQFLAHQDKFITPSAHCMFWFAMDHYSYTVDMFTKHGWRVFPDPLVWHKNDNTGMLPDPKRQPRNVYETALMMSRGDRFIAKPISNLQGFPGRNKDIHRSEKPIDMLTKFFELFVDNTTTMLDPTAGSGNAVIAAKQSGAKTVLGLEIDEDFHTAAVAHYKEHVYD